MKKLTGKFRVAIQIIILIIVTVVATLHQKLGGGFEGAPTVHALCPFGYFESFYNVITGKSYILKTYWSNAVVAVASVGIVFIVGRIFCGWICALGTIQDIPKFFVKKKFIVPEKLDKVLSNLKYLVLIIIIFLTWKTAKLVIDPYDPFAAYTHIPAGFESLLADYSIGFGSLVLMFIVSFFYERLFCKYLCPLGAIYAIVGKISPFKIKRNKSTCIDCKKCTNVCPAHIKVSELDEVKPVECYSCMKCVSTCPTKTNSLDTVLVTKKTSMKKLVIIGLVVYFGAIGISKALGIFQTMPPTMGAVIQNNPEHIRGWMTYEQVIKEFNLNEDELYEKLGFTKEELPPTTPIKQSKEAYEKKGLEFDDDIIRKIVGEMIKK